MITALTFSEEPRTGLEPMSRSVFKIDRKGMAQCYDTAAGVGVVGRSIADLAERKKGVPFWVLILAVIVMIACLWKLPFVAGFAAKLGIKKEEKHPMRPAPGGTNRTTLSLPVTSGDRAGPATNSDRRTQQASTNGPPLMMTGFAFIPGRGITVTLSDGRVLNSWTGDVKRITRTNCVVDGVNCPLLVVRR